MQHVPLAVSVAMQHVPLAVSVAMQHVPLAVSVAMQHVPLAMSVAMQHVPLAVSVAMQQQGSAFSTFPWLSHCAVHVHRAKNTQGDFEHFSISTSCVPYFSCALFLGLGEGDGGVYDVMHKAG